jgi:hypothetical protein
MIEHQLEALQSEAWGVSGEEATLDYARRVREYLEAQEFETGDGSLESLPDIVQHICGHADAIERRKAEQAIPWQTKLADFMREAVERERTKMLLKYPFMGSVIMAYDPSYKTEKEIEEFKKVMWEFATDYAINDIISAGNKPEDGAGVTGLPAPVTNSLFHIDEEDYPEGMFCSPEDGGGKSEFIREMCEERGIEVEEITLSSRNINPLDMMGIPIVNKKDQSVEWAPPKFAEGKSVFFFDEIDPYPERDNGAERE